ncbi:DUF6907 domain-containing protein [Streptomyces sp. NPDC058741]|uniref:DUF6907 domain-containing protein n=1 Tax=unclassified Streptomyces TaxID=2593676 RepID=UPI003687F581
MQDPIRSITLPTIDHGPVTLPEPAWCAGHADHCPDAYRIDITHRGPDHILTLPVRGGYAELLVVALEERPFTEAWPGTRPFVSVGFNGDSYPAQLHRLEDMAAELERHAEVLREFARCLAVILAGGAW